MSHGDKLTRKPKRKEDRIAAQRRKFLSLLAAAGGVATVASMAPWAEFMLSSIIKGGDEGRQQIRLPLPDGRTPSVELEPKGVQKKNKFLPNTHGTFVYPRTGDPVADSEPFRRFQLIRLHPDLGGDAEDVSAFRAYSMICVHLWCLWDYYSDRMPKGSQTSGSIECPCHGSKYNPVDGVAVAGPASLQTPPNNALAQLTLDVNDDNTLVVVPPVWNVNENGVVGFGRYVNR